MDDEPRVILPSNERFLFVCELARKHTNGNRFKVFPSPEYLNTSDADKGDDLHERYKETVWWIGWSDATYDQLAFGELLTFLELSIQAAQSRKAAVDKANSVAAKLGFGKTKREGAWQPKKSRDGKRKPVRVTVQSGLDFVLLATDGKIRLLLGGVMIESSLRPPEAVN